MAEVPNGQGGGTPPSKAKQILAHKATTAVMGFIAGAIVATIVLYPWLHFLGKLCQTVNTGS